MIIVNQEILGMNLMTNKFDKFSKINIGYNDIHTLVYFEQIPKITNLILLPNLKKIYIHSGDMVRTFSQKLPVKKIQKFFSEINILRNLTYLSIIGLDLQFDKINMNYFDNLPYNLEVLEFSLFRYKHLTLKNLPYGLTKLNIEIEEDVCDKTYNFDIKMPFGCELTIIPNIKLFTRQSTSFSINQIYLKYRPLFF